MSKRHRGIRTGALVALASALLLESAGCAVGLRVYDPEYGVYHSWDRNEESVFRIYLGERHEHYRTFRNLDDGQQRDYWKWRHEHGDVDRH